MFRFLHTSDLHLGKRFGNFSGDLPGRLREARHAVIATLARHARDHGAQAVLLAGDTFDTETPSPDVRRQALAEMGHHAPLKWILLPGNHDSLQAAELWARLKAEAPENVVLALEPRPLQLAADTILFPAPCTTRRPGRDLTDWMGNEVSGEGVLRLGLAHGAVQNFSEESVLDVIAPDRARRAGLDYLALGDWHGAVEVDARTRYSGAPEPDRFKHERPGEALLVSIEGPGAVPEVKSLPTAAFTWRTLHVDLFAGDDPAPALEALLPEARLRRQSLVRIVTAGRIRLSERAALVETIERAKPEYAYLDLDDANLATECDAGDLDSIDRGGALREAANALLAQAEDARLGQEDREIARAALARLFSYAREIEA